MASRPGLAFAVVLGALSMVGVGARADDPETVPHVEPPAPPPKKPAPVPAPAKTQKPATKPVAKGTPGVRTPDPFARRGVAGGPTAEDIQAGFESPELAALRQAELELFPPALPALGAPWPDELASPLSANAAFPQAHATGLPPSLPSGAPMSVAEGGHDVSWLSHLTLPDIPVRWDARVVRFLEFYRDDPRGKQLIAYWYKRSGRYRDTIRRSLRKKALPEDLYWLAMVESGFDASARSPAGAGGLWQLTSDTAHLYGLSTDRWADQRFNAAAETEAAVEMLSDLYRRFGSWELAMAAYNMGYGGTMSVVRRYNTNDYWTLSKLEAALPWETVLYVPKLVAAAIVGKNPRVFGLADVVVDGPLDGDEVRVAPGTSLQSIATAAGCSLKEVEALNVELRAGRTPPAPSGTPLEGASYPVRVPLGKGQNLLASLAKLHDVAPPLDRYVVKFGESLDQVALAHKTSTARVVELNAIAPGEVVHGGTVLLLPHVPAGAAPTKPAEPAALAETAKPAIVVPPDVFVYPGRKRVFYRVLTGDTLPDIAAHLHVDVDDLRRWNDLDPAARLQDGMTLQAFVPEGADVSHVTLLGADAVRVLVSGTDELFAYWEGTKGKKRVVVKAKKGDTIEGIGHAHGVNAASMERINGRGRHEALAEGDTVVVYVPAPGASPGASPVAPSDPKTWLPQFAVLPIPNGPLPMAPEPSLLPPLP
jgi:membrane-bound lytic murein transglycosylase D